MYGYIYLTTNKLNGKQYIGQHKSKKWDNNYKGSGQHLKSAFKKYGKDNFECHIISTADSLEELNEMEMVYIDLYCTMFTGYNLNEGGDGNKGYEHTEESKKKMAESLKGENNPCYGKHFSEETRKKMAESHNGHIVPEETKKKIAERLKGYFTSEEARKKTSIPVVRLTKEGEFVSEYFGTREAERQTGIAQQNITACCKGRLKSAGGFKWMYKSDYEQTKKGE